MALREGGYKKVSLQQAQSTDDLLIRKERGGHGGLNLDARIRSVKKSSEFESNTVDLLLQLGWITARRLETFRIEINDIVDIVLRC